MTVATSRKVNFDKLYMVWEPPYATWKANGTEYAHPTIRLGYSNYESDGKRWMNSIALITFQVSLQRDSSEDRILNDGIPYGGKIEVDINDAAVVGKIIDKAMKKSQELNPHDQNPMNALIVGLRANGYSHAIQRTASTDIAYFD